MSIGCTKVREMQPEAAEASKRATPMALGADDRGRGRVALGSRSFRKKMDGGMVQGRIVKEIKAVPCA